MRRPFTSFLLIATFILLTNSSPGVLAESPSRTDLSRKLSLSEWRRSKVVEQMDREGLRFREKAITVQSDDLLKVPEIAGDITGATVAKVAPRIDFGIVPLEPRFFFETPAGDGGLWCIWGQGTYHKGKYYGSVGNHIFYDARIHVIEYDPNTMKMRVSPELNEAAGLPIEYGDGKIHGSLDFYGEGRTMYFMSYWTEYPEPKEAQWLLGYEGGRLMSYNFDTGKFQDLGVPMKRVSWPYHRMDRKRGLMYAVGSMNEFMCYDIEEHRMLYGGYAPRGILWYDRCMIVDEESGCAYSSNLSPDDTEIHMIKYDSAKNRFFRMESCVPKTESKAFQGDQIRAHTPRKSKDGWFICVTRAGRMFEFYPDEDRIEDLGLCWPAPPEKLYTASITLSPDERYVYYIPGAHGGAHRLGCPIVQYDTKTRERKALAFLFPYLYEKYRYITGGTFSMDIDEKGERLFIYMNGAFAKYDPNGGDVFGDPSVIVVHIPESERR